MGSLWVLLLPLLSLLGSSIADWKEELYYEESDASSCSNLIYVEVTEVSSCSESTCYYGYDYNTRTKCHDVPPDMDSYFDDEYYSTILSSDILGMKVTGFVVANKSCVLAYFLTSYRGWNCDDAAGIIAKWNFGLDSTCSSGGSEYEQVTPYSYNKRFADVFVGYGSWYTVDCDNTATPVSGYQLITYYPAQSWSTSTCASLPVLGYEYFYTDDCKVHDCAVGVMWKESWSCTDTKPDPATLFPDTANPPFVLQYFDTNDNFCTSSDILTTQLWASSCLVVSTTSFQVAESSNSLNFESFSSSTDCTGSYSNVLYIYKNGDQKVPGCYSTYEDVWYTLAKNQVPNEKYQTVEYHAGAGATATTMMIEQYFSHYCETKTVPATDSDMFENWLCTDLDTLPDPFEDYWDDALLNVYYGVEASTCGESRDWLYRRAMNRDCVADADTSKGFWNFDCSSTADAASLLLSQGGDSNCTGGSSSTLEDSSSKGMDYCFSDSNADDSYFELHCDPPNPGYQIIKTYADTAKTDLISVEVFYTDYCTDAEPTSLYFAFDYSCQASIDTLTIDIDMPITVTRFSDSTCTTPKKHWAYYSPECHDSDITTDSYHVTCSADDSNSDVYVSSCDADTLDGCRGSCSYFSEEVDATRWIGYADGCFWDYDSGSYVTVECAPANPKWQAVYSFPGPNVLATTGDKVIDMHYFWSENCVEYDIGWTYASGNVVQTAVCTPNEPNIYGLWDDAYTVHVINSADDTLDSTWGYNPGCVQHQTATESYSHSCSWEQSTFSGSISTLAYSTTGCTGSSTSSSVTPVGMNTDYYSADYFCLAPNDMWQVVKMHLYGEEDPVFRVVTYINPFCQVTSGFLESTFYYESECHEIGTDDPEAGDYFTYDPVEVLWFSDSTCSGNATYTSWYNLDCMQYRSYAAFVSYCSLENAQATLAFPWGPVCPSSLESIFLRLDLVAPTGSGSAVCNDLFSSFDDLFETENYLLTSCGEFNDLMRYDVEILTDTDDCAGVPVYAQGTLTRFCDHTEDGTCHLKNEETGTYLNHTCLKQATFQGGAALLLSESSSCNLEEITEVFFYRGGDCVCNEEGECWSLECTHTTTSDDGAEQQQGTITFTRYSSMSTCNSTGSVDEYPDGECDGSGKLWLCPAPRLGAAAAASLLSILMLCTYSRTEPSDVLVNKKFKAISLKTRPLNEATPRNSSYMQVVDVKVTKPSWLGDVAFLRVLRASDQFAVLVVAVRSARCGEHSPARVLGTQLLKQLWDDWVVGCHRVLVLSVMVSPRNNPHADDDLVHRCFIRFGVSPLLMGVTTAVLIVEARDLAAERMLMWFDENRFLEMAADGGAVQIRDTVTGQTTKISDKGIWQANGQWWLHIRNKGRGLAVMPVGPELTPPVVVELPESRDIHFAMDKVVSSQAVGLVQQVDGGYAFWVVDVAETFSTGTLQVVSRTPFMFPQLNLDESGWKAVKFFVLDNKSSQSVFIVSTFEEVSWMSLVVAVHSDGRVKVLYPHESMCTLEQVSCSGFLVHHTDRHRLDIWDYNKTTNEVATIRIIQAHATILGGGGFIVLIQDSENLQVIDAASMLVVLQLKLDGWAMILLPDTSFLKPIKAMSVDQPTPPASKRARIDVDPNPSLRFNNAKATQPSWLGDVRFGSALVARAQFASLVVAAQCPTRCGARSPARVLGTHLLRQLWDDWVVGCQRVLVLDAAVFQRGTSGNNPGLERRCTFRFGMSPILMGVTTVVQVEATGKLIGNDENSKKRVDGDRYLEMENGGHPEVWIRNSTTGEERFLRQEDGSAVASCANAKWWVQLKKEGMELSITDIEVEGGDLAPEVSLMLPDDIVPDSSCLALDRLVSSQAVLLMEHIHGTRRFSSFLVVDLAKTFSTRTLQVAESTTCVFPHQNTSVVWKVGEILMMRTRSNQTVFIVDTFNWEGKSIILAVQPNGDVTKIYTQVYDCRIFQVSSSLFSIYNDEANRLDIWDCNETTKKHPVSRSMHELEDQGIMGGFGFITFVQDGELQVIEASSGVVVLSMEIDAWRIAGLFSETSFM
ncbi:hypothetical protein Pelo_899 [Pelomyxa schiedti]|nr:hypothetical protein Pelo_899 [Pelomyxa schiedti]